MLGANVVAGIVCAACLVDRYSGLFAECPPQSQGTSGAHPSSSPDTHSDGLAGFAVPAGAVCVDPTSLFVATAGFLGGVLETASFFWREGYVLSWSHTRGSRMFRLRPLLPEIVADAVVTAAGVLAAAVAAQYLVGGFIEAVACHVGKMYFAGATVIMRPVEVALGAALAEVGAAVKAESDVVLYLQLFVALLITSFLWTLGTSFYVLILSARGNVVSARAGGGGGRGADRENGNHCFIHHDPPIRNASNAPFIPPFFPVMLAPTGPPPRTRNNTTRMPPPAAGADGAAGP